MCGVLAILTVLTWQCLLELMIQLEENLPEQENVVSEWLMGSSCQKGHFVELVATSEVNRKGGGVTYQIRRGLKMGKVWHGREHACD